MDIGNNAISFLLYGAAALFALGVILSLLARAGKNDGDDKADQLEKALPGAQCAQCGYPGCRAYAEAMANGTAACNKCTPGGQDTIDTLASILGVSVPADESEDAIFAPRTVAIIHESLCTGCTKCTRHCPVDAIRGERRVVHTVMENECIGCNECVNKCPEKCIEMVRLEPTIANFNWELHPIRFKGTN
ncbi:MULTISPECIES: RnfABCDGE type electron transport complex subunit B [unclassified Anaerobiospirillum]|uniref:RnfABCDGE type electron transport complex subunit B n=1 Tax=unclassified Anaerobiospirillum TaxID=2647410 RepID=UPI001FF48B18|nr:MULTISPECIES: RnfABCDGE type electron transport complex subunit B [unclassified Anaerobiospirillum]MCK0526010.1 RnfABCDGE type electron transport complex subunit B [Anaerobiospirillum sp. NML120449]MCK0535046.1 RnfABCDGE type electron transport complex subunit B [Anaerobiospirillum sp. NML120511]MCK0540171.1 RnfABCDGE type electron transport complex subunit B [Anaerobiospirillum sp. NML02-A-032]